MADMQTAIDTVKVGVGVTGGVASAITLNKAVMIVTIIYVVMQAGLLIPRYLELLKKATKWVKNRTSSVLSRIKKWWGCIRT